MKSLSICGLIILAFVVGLLTGRNAPGERLPPKVVHQRPADTAPTAFRISVPAETNGEPRTVRTLRVRHSDPERADQMWVVYEIVDGVTYGHTCEVAPATE